MYCNLFNQSQLTGHWRMSNLILFKQHCGYTNSLVWQKWNCWVKDSAHLNLNTFDSKTLQPINATEDSVGMPGRVVLCFTESHIRKLRVFSGENQTPIPWTIFWTFLEMNIWTLLLTMSEAWWKIGWSSPAPVPAVPSLQFRSPRGTWRLFSDGILRVRRHLQEAAFSEELHLLLTRLFCSP